MSSSVAAFPLLTVMATSAALQGLAILLTIWRLCYRISIRRFFWDDGWAATSMLCDMGFLISDWVRLKVCIRSHEASMIVYWVYAIGFECSVWTARMSILCSITRLMPSSKHSRRITLIFATLFALMWCGVVVQIVHKCDSGRSYLPSGAVMCPFSSVFDVYELAIDVVSDAILVVLPLRLLWDVKLPRQSQRRLILSSFSTSMAVSIISVFRTTCRLMKLTPLVFVSAELELVVCLVVCNLLVFATYIDRRLRKHEEDGNPETDDAHGDYPSQDSPVTSMHLTTVDLEDRGGFGTYVNWNMSPEDISALPAV
ncbi:hypothetical protein BV22DRAFT_1037839 [Leucogyrophana mollusca]|uniref:Uncharacterized protein n=1 Tax=Leucogyrophana mollusca TaxID=85980 RepID=A0ACB8BA76_9AGAM|nr:hypothetical protein BV22DRAFT_1037839 [Leucogyrophana mollusca]